MLKSSGGVGAATLTSRVLGLVRELIYARFMGTTATASAFFYAFMIPNLFRRLLGEGALTAAFIPLFKAREKNDGPEEMWRSANAVISALLVMASAITLLVILGVTVLLSVKAWKPETQLMFELLRIMFPYMILACLAAVFIGILNARGHFFIPSLGTAILNVALIGSVFLLAPHFGRKLETQVFGLAAGVLVAGVAQAFFQLPVLRKEGFKYRWVAPWRDQTVREVVQKMIPSAIGVAAFQLNVVTTQSLAFGENSHIVSEFNYAVRLMELPQGVFGLSLATFLLPTLSSLAIDKNYAQFRATLRQATGYLIFINLLASALLFTLAEPIIRLLFERGKFDAVSTAHASAGLVALAPGLVSFSLVNIFARAFYAVNDIKTPMKVSIFCLALNLVLTAYFLIGLGMGPGALGLANTATSFCNLGLLAFGLRKKLKTLEMRPCLEHLPALIGAAVAAGMAAWTTRLFWQAHYGHANFAARAGEVFIPMILASALYLLLNVWLKVPSAREILAFVRRRQAKIA
jgi:putative peptidoglycan lipid II flippase